jgi:ABC-type branched-subunit amino acid transport system permease subunit
MTRMLLPENFKVKGLTMIAIAFIGLWISSQNGLINLYRIILPGETLPDGSYPYPPDFWENNLILTYIAAGLMVAGLLCFFLSRERDEFFYKVRLESIQFAIIAQLFIAIALYSCLYLSGIFEMENTLTGILTISFACFWLTFSLRYYYIICFNANRD